MPLRKTISTEKILTHSWWKHFEEEMDNHGLSIPINAAEISLSFKQAQKRQPRKINFIEEDMPAEYFDDSPEDTTITPGWKRSPLGIFIAFFNYDAVLIIPLDGIKSEPVIIFKKSGLKLNEYRTDININGSFKIKHGDFAIFWNDKQLFKIPKQVKTQYGQNFIKYLYTNTPHIENPEIIELPLSIFTNKLITIGGPHIKIVHKYLSYFKQIIIKYGKRRKEYEHNLILKSIQLVFKKVKTINIKSLPIPLIQDQVSKLDVKGTFNPSNRTISRAIENLMSAYSDDKNTAVEFIRTSSLNNVKKIYWFFLADKKIPPIKV